MNSNVTQVLKLYIDKAVSDMPDPLNIKEQNLILIPVTNSNCLDIIESNFGKLWNLLRFERKTHYFYYYDSLNPLNFEESKKLLIYQGLEYSPKMKQIKGPAQHNSYDCG